MLGAGKTTLLNVLWGGIERDVKGTVRLGYIKGAARKRLIGYVFQEDLFYQGLRVNQQVHFMAHLRLPSGLNSAFREHLV